MRRRGTMTLIRFMLIGALAAALPAPVIAVEPDPSALPDLAMLPPTDFSIQKRPRGVRWLRFDTVVVNLGPAPFEVIGRDDPADATADLRVYQLLNVDGQVTEQLTPAYMFYAGDGHDHWHVRDLQDWVLTNGNAEVLRRGAKTGFCFWDNYRYGSAASPVYHPSTTSACEDRGDGSVPMGLSAGWGDEYPSTIAFQYIDISGLPNGDYTITVTADADGWFAEADRGNNTSWTKIRITRKGVQVLEYGPSP